MWVTLAVPQCHLQEKTSHCHFIQFDPAAVAFVFTTHCPNWAWPSVVFSSVLGYWVSVLWWSGVSPLLLHGDCVSLSLSFFPTNRRQHLSRSRPLCFPTSRCPSVASSLCRPRTPASVPTLASQTASTARLRAVGQRRWTSTATRCTSATTPTRRYELICCLFPLVVSVGACGDWIWGWSWGFPTSTVIKRC